MSRANRQKNQRVARGHKHGALDGLGPFGNCSECEMWIWSTSVRAQPDYPPHSRPTFTSLMGPSRFLLFSFHVTFESRLQVPDAFSHAPVPVGAERARDCHHISASYIMLLTDSWIALSPLTSHFRPFVPSSLTLSSKLYLSLWQVRAHGFQRSRRGLVP